ncbi:MAG: hypothetical protein KIG95_01595 [Comamonas sp.]|nr:hypothetical protein [Comamonas sp.]
MQLQQALEQMDGMLDLLAPLLSGNEPDAIEQAAEQLRQSMSAFVRLAQQFEPAAFTPRNVAHMQAISERLTQMRGHIIKMAAITSQQLQTLLPEQSGGNHTYGASKIPPGAAASVARLYHVSG